MIKKNRLIPLLF